MCIINTAFLTRNDCIEILDLRRGKISTEPYALPLPRGNVFDELLASDCGWQNLVTYFRC